MEQSAQVENDYRFYPVEESKILTEILDKHGIKIKRKVGKLISEFSATTKHVKESNNMSLREKRYIINLMRTRAIDSVNSRNFPLEVETFTKNLLHIIYVNNVM